MADPSSQISRGALSAIFNNAELAMQQYGNPVMQCLQVKPMAAQGNTGERYRIVLSDLTNYCQCMLATQANHVVHDGKLDRGRIVRVKAYNPTSVKGKKYVCLHRPKSFVRTCPH